MISCFFAWTHTVKLQWPPHACTTIHTPVHTLIQVGWIVGVSLLVVSAAGSVYSGILIDSVAAKVGSDPIHGGPPRKYADLGRAAFGSRGETVVKATQYAFLAGCIVAVQLTASQSLHTVIHALHGESCLVVCNTVIAVIMLPIMQLQVRENDAIRITIHLASPLLIPPPRPRPSLPDPLVLMWCSTRHKIQKSPFGLLWFGMARPCIHNTNHGWMDAPRQLYTSACVARHSSRRSLV